ncbi:NACHT domain-containing protein [Halalkaliarchaeum sp. AArc-CO]|uniref:NACHT domain-containing protein n=1 Tax=Halalkaliarchaeum sp. AArc-CO TaxID=2866381 RepID=UPI00217E446F|nr:NACHT domain-containing protein [Halalkaliarchaeum sp. AArc-CO]UWG50153.1 NACHT domain-containing protein [Halalkaliarchaeum sp. AArc-CO]
MTENERTATESENMDASASTRRMAGAARGYTFQDVIAGACILSVFFEESQAITIESKLNEGDKFDDIILEQDGDIICIQVKNGPDHTLSSSDLTGSSGRGLDLSNLSESAEARVQAGEGTRFIALTSFGSETGPDIEFLDDSENITLFGELSFETDILADGRNEVDGEIVDIEFVLGVPGIGTATDEKVESLRNTELFERIVESVTSRLNIRENPEIDDPYSLTERAVNLARWARNQPVDVQRLDREEIIHRLKLFPSKQFAQQFELPEKYIRPRWTEELEEAFDDSDNRVLVEGSPGSGKSVGIELFHRSWEDSDDYRTLRFYLYVPEDADSLEKRRGDPEWFRHQLAAQIYDTFPEAFGEGTPAPVWTGTEDLQQYIDKVAQWAEQEEQQILFIIDGLDHALRQFGGTSATESAEGTVLEELGSLDFPNPLGLLMISREITEAHDILRVDNQIEVPRWSVEEIKEYLERKNIPPEDEFVRRVAEISGGLPVIISHLIRKAETQGEEVIEGLQSAIEDASHVDGELEQYYDTIWEPLEPYERDVVSLFALNPTGLREETIKSVVDFPYIQESTRLEGAPLAHILESTADGRFRVFHDSFRKFVEDQLDQEEITQGHERLYEYLFDQCIKFPQNLESLKYHAENGPGRSALKELATLENLLCWWQEGIHLDHLSKTLDLAFDVSLRDEDYFTAVDCILLGGVARNMLDIYMEDNSRLRYFAAQSDLGRALRLVDQIRGYEGGSKEAIEAMQIVARNWEDELERDWLAAWEEDYQRAEQPSWDPEAYFEVASEILEPQEFWKAAGEIRREDNGQHFPREVLAAVQNKPELLEGQPEPPEWLFENESVALEACEDLIHDLPEPWREELKENAPDYSDLSLAALHTLLRCGGAEDEIREVIENTELGEPIDDWGQGGSRFYEVYYTGSIVASLDESPEELLETIDRIAIEQPRFQKLLAMMGAATTRDSSTQSQRWVDATLEFLCRIFEEGHLVDSDVRYVDQFRYQQAVSDIAGAFRKVVKQGSEDQLSEAIQLNKEADFEDRTLETVSRYLTEAWEEVNTEALPDGIDERYENILKRPPSEEPPSRELMDLAVRAAKEGYDSRAENYVEVAVERCFRYGYRKDIFLNDVWKGLEDVADGQWDRHLGTAIQLINWANLLHDLTDGKETRHFEGVFLKSLLDADAVDYHTAEKYAEHNTTQRKLWNWRLENPDGMTAEELRSLIYVKETRIRSRRHSNRELPFFSKAAEVADNFGWDELVVKALHALNRGDYVRDGINSDREQRLRDLASQYDIEIPSDLDSDNGSSEFEGESVETESEDDRIHEILSQHSEEDPVSVESVEELTSEELLNAGELLQKDMVGSPRYNPAAAAPISRVLADRGNVDDAIELLENVIAERDLINSWLGGGRGRFEMVAEALLDINEERALQSVLNGWRMSRLDTQSYLSILPQLLWIVKQTEGEIAAEELFSHMMKWMRRLVWPYENHVQKWGVLESDEHSTR